MAAKSVNDQADAPGRLITPGRAAAAVIVILLIAFVVDNTNKVRVGFVFFHAEVSLIWVLIITALLDWSSAYSSVDGASDPATLGPEPSGPGLWLRPRCALDLQDALAAIDVAAAGLPPHLALRLSGHVGSVTRIIDPVLGTTSFLGSHINRTAEDRTSHSSRRGLRDRGISRHCWSWLGAASFVVTTPVICLRPRDYGRLRMYLLVRRTPVVPDAVAPRP